MLKLVIKGEEFFNEESSKFHSVNDVVLHLEHSLLSLSKWESKYQKPFLGKSEKTNEEIFGYIESMVLESDELTAELFTRLTREHLKTITDYIESKESATTFGSMPERRGAGEVITSELIYYWMVAYQIPFHPAETWHLNRLFSLVRICNMKNQPQKKMSRNELAQKNRELNAQRRAMYNTRG